MLQSSTQTSVFDVLTHVQASQAEGQAKLDALFLKYRALPLGSDEHRQTSLEIAETHGGVLALAKLAGYLEARGWIDEINSLPLPVSLS